VKASGRPRQTRCCVIRSPRPPGHECFRVVVRKKQRHIELAGLQIISAAPAIHHAGLHGLAGLDVGVPRKADDEIPVLRPRCSWCPGGAEPKLIALSAVPPARPPAQCRSAETKAQAAPSPLLRRGACGFLPSPGTIQWPTILAVTWWVGWLCMVDLKHPGPQPERVSDWGLPAGKGEQVVDYPFTRMKEPERRRNEIARWLPNIGSWPRVLERDVREIGAKKGAQARAPRRRSDTAPRTCQLRSM
jgi:hypothetical protein